ncbi:hypothetical protein SEA_PHRAPPUCCINO_179 [Mycobacterium phage Phrappuccino]|uniref:Uncharacterized protein n=1 Tax=Mycobacterium phage Phrappuccino TaxID=2591223 RepID=A0A514DE19_9CAUD|nr:hypothetical protein KHQ87_gp179 [Mycobacterium phage Phrappuccino]QDH91854.1 hypothetical protein SEA_PHRAPPUCCINO_179 [Mycobacterium phage Phrappuccino]QIQ63295.1 hypothetical protein SEA_SETTECANDELA_179 [Mycobacterium phage Settecandela]
MSEKCEKARKANYLTGAVRVTTCTYQDGGVGVEASMYFDEGCEAERDAWIAQFPKSYRIRSNTLNGQEQNYYADRPFPTGFVAVDKVTGEELSAEEKSANPRRYQWRLPMAQFRVVLAATGVTGDKNETGYKRLVGFLRKLDTLGIQWEHEMQRVATEQPTIEQILARYA